MTCTLFLLASYLRGWFTPGKRQIVWEMGIRGKGRTGCNSLSGVERKAIFPLSDPPVRASRDIWSSDGRNTEAILHTLLSKLERTNDCQTPVDETLPLAPPPYGSVSLCHGSELQAMNSEDIACTSCLLPLFILFS